MADQPETVFGRTHQEVRDARKLRKHHPIVFWALVVGIVVWGWDHFRGRAAVTELKESYREDNDRLTKKISEELAENARLRLELNGLHAKYAPLDALAKAKFPDAADYIRRFTNEFVPRLLLLETNQAFLRTIRVAAGFGVRYAGVNTAAASASEEGDGTLIWIVSTNATEPPIPLTSKQIRARQSDGRHLISFEAEAEFQSFSLGRQITNFASYTLFKVDLAPALRPPSLAGAKALTVEAFDVTIYVNELPCGKLINTNAGISLVESNSFYLIGNRPAICADPGAW